MTHTTIEVERILSPDGPSKKWFFVETTDGWSDSTGDAASATGTVRDALWESGVSEYIPGAALRIVTSGDVSPFSLVPALDGWLEGSESLGESVWGWSERDGFGWLESIPSEDFLELSIDPQRVILIDDFLLAACTVLVGSGPTAYRKRLHVLFDASDGGHLIPVFYDAWARVWTDNGYGHGRHLTGELVPGFRGSVHLHDDAVPPYLRVEELPSNSNGLFELVRNWVAGCVHQTPQPNTGRGFEVFEVLVQDDEIVIEFPDDDSPSAVVEVWLSPAVRSAMPETP